jgi:hypothetical protein
VYAVKFAGGTNDTGAVVYFGSRYVHRELRDQVDQEQRIKAVFGVATYCNDMMSAGHRGAFPKAVFSVHAVPHVAYLNPEWMRTVALVTPRNISNGTVPVPPDVRAAHPVLEDGDWCALPENHVLALYLGQYARDPGDADWNDKVTANTPHPVRVRLDDHCCYYFVLAHELQALAEQFFRLWKPKLDCIQLQEIPFHLVWNRERPPRPDTRATLDVSVGYVDWDQAAPTDHLLPIASPSLVC